MPEDPDEHVAMEFHGLVSDLQRGDVERFEADLKHQARLRAELRRSDPDRGGGLSAGELLKKMDGDPEAAGKKLQDELDRAASEAKVATDKQKEVRAALPDGHFPPPPEKE